MAVVERTSPTVRPIAVVGVAEFVDLRACRINDADFFAIVTQAPCPWADYRRGHGGVFRCEGGGVGSDDYEAVGRNGDCGKGESQPVREGPIGEIDGVREVGVVEFDELFSEWLGGLVRMRGVKHDFVDHDIRRERVGGKNESCEKGTGDRVE